MNNKGIIGAIIGDIVGSRFEFNNYRSTDFQLFNDNCFFTDDSVMTIAVADWITNKSKTPKQLSSYMREWGRKYPNSGYVVCFLDGCSQEIYCLLIIVLAMDLQCASVLVDFLHILFKKHWI